MNLSSRRIAVSALFAAALILPPGSDSYAQSQEPAYDPFDHAGILHIGFLNPDCVPDTVIGYLSPNLHWVPTAIVWGDAFDDEGEPLCEGNGREPHLQAHRHRDTTHIVAPDWNDFACAFSVQRINTNDTLDDLIFWMRGVDSVHGDGGSRIAHDTGRAVVLFGQERLSTHQAIELDDIRSVQTGPFCAMQLGFRQHLVNPKSRDHSGKASWELLRLDHEATPEEDTTQAAPGRISAVAGMERQRSRLYPNPAIYTTTLEIAPLSAGIYTIEIVAVDGRRLSRTEIRVEEKGELFEIIDLSSLSSGHYVVRITTATVSIGEYPVVVVR